MDNYIDINLDEKKSEAYLNILNEMNGSINLVLDDFKQKYLMSKMYPTNEEFQQDYQNVISNINKIQSQLFSTSNNIQSDTNILNQKLFDINSLIEKEKTKNKELKKLLGIAESNNNSAQEMIDDYKQIYNINYLRNWSLFLSTILCMITISIIYRKKVV